LCLAVIGPRGLIRLVPRDIAREINLSAEAMLGTLARWLLMTHAAFLEYGMNAKSTPRQAACRRASGAS
jgi:hypothetical protein